ncbi:MAG: tRNA (adenosine(37)-N6)-threonylcarbamoyltransferase complex ATPase subunit type 1 TsaE [Candidatus Levybacteria bacterium]|nr:tRNA (adenosine(37)-N6)-threonylcarbamoyltransferase complex ATPase subunit type 1 TsaE [Candidatus Levybacteria bacterium]
MNNQTKVYITKNLEETQELAKNLSKTLEKSNVLALYGELGSGKTTFAQGLAKSLGIKKRIISPTFIILRAYKLKPQTPNPKSQKVKSFYHVDLYRIKDEKDIEGLGIDEIIKDKKNIVAIEWAEKIEKFLPRKRWDITFEHLNDNQRRITINKLT